MPIVPPFVQINLGHVEKLPAEIFNPSVFIMPEYTSICVDKQMAAAVENHSLVVLQFIIAYDEGHWTLRCLTSSSIVKVNAAGWSETETAFLSQYPEAMIPAEGACVKKGSLLAGLGMTLFGTFVLLNNLDKPRIAAAGLHGSDILGLVASGMCFGVALMVLTASIWARKE